MDVCAVFVWFRLCSTAEVLLCRPLAVCSYDYTSDRPRCPVFRYVEIMCDICVRFCALFCTIFLLFPHYFLRDIARYFDVLPLVKTHVPANFAET